MEKSVRNIQEAAVEMKRHAPNNTAGGTKKIKVRPYQEVVDEANKIWDCAKGAGLKTLAPAEREARVAAVLEVLGDHVADVCLKHDASRVMQQCVKFGSDDQRLVIFTGVQDKLPVLVKSQYGHHVVVKLMTYGDVKIKSAISEMLAGDLRALSLHQYAAKCVDYYWRELTRNATSRSELVSATFYGGRRSDIVGKPATDKDADIEGTVLRTKALKSLGGFVNKSLGKPGLFSMAFQHRAVLEFFEVVEPGSQDHEDAMVDLAGNNGDILKCLVQTRDGTEVVVRMLAGSTGHKVRKLVVKGLKGVVAEMAADELAWAAVLGTLWFVDDTVIVKKTVVEELCDAMRAVLDSVHGPKVVLGALLPREAALKALTAQDKDMFSTLDNTRKDQSLRRDEILDSRLVSVVAEALTPADLTRDWMARLAALPGLQARLFELIAESDLDLWSHSSGHKLVKTVLGAAAGADALAVVTKAIAGGVMKTRGSWVVAEVLKQALARGDAPAPFKDTVRTHAEPQSPAGRAILELLA